MRATNRERQHLNSARSLSALSFTVGSTFQARTARLSPNIPTCFSPRSAKSTSPPTTSAPATVPTNSPRPLGPRNLQSARQDYSVLPLLGGAFAGTSAHALPSSCTRLPHPVHIPTSRVLRPLQVHRCSSGAHERPRCWPRPDPHKHRPDMLVRALLLVCRAGPHLVCLRPDPTRVRCSQASAHPTASSTLARIAHPRAGDADGAGSSMFCFPRIGTTARRTYSSGNCCWLTRCLWGAYGMSLMMTLHHHVALLSRVTILVIDIVSALERDLDTERPNVVLGASALG